ncbi:MULTISPECIES: translation elongation factor EF-1 subunit alpha [Methanothermobacter]|uniref:Elongation factor 1-alpha n=1 Tax=Methanothermobacter marburgensis (strain ATCC BAA-927 / DSM 2133 / JCM 14651 / NBRC 100331 / OCM 82 / Marburg) TaxID=79929 RepID=D9PXS9_METTM|nr:MULTISPECIES: translation elongation factor EF-1 subunit alpha [Methanothermobacter]ADL59027.1 protein translation elongation factor Tu [Methanothermobacter marburgensis str. Marburg]MCG2828276.1 translation elongation factor EF-1 subunit alpha [Methanothermobacter sp. K4]QHN07932.1 translation elongation factor EF-1 subunit alpha [Methanothermobacter sp. THM-2]WBF09558.1 translation elongation factor EF-1 subunit alpha [Methanothermobacter marburgensis]
MAKEKEHMNLAFIGHVDHGKSTLVGHLLLQAGAIAEQQLADGEDKFRFVMDRLSEERERGVTIDLAHAKFETDKYEFTIVDCPGHRDFVKNMITGASQADAAVLVVAVDDGVMPQTKEHVFLSRTLGINQLIVAINKMDLVNYDEEKFNALKDEVAALIKTVGYKPSDVEFIPLSAFEGDNITTKSDNTAWYKGKTLVEALDELEAPEKPVDLPLRIPIQDVYSITGVGTVPVGRVETGTLKKGENVIFEPAGVSGEVKSIEMHHEMIDQAEPGDNIGFNVRGVGKNDIRRGDVAGHLDNPPKVAKEFTAQIVVLQHPGVITVGYTPVFHCHTAQVACTFLELVQKMNPATGQVEEENPDFLKTGNAAVVKVKPTKPLVIEKIKDIPHMGRFAIRDMGQTVAAGMCIDLVPAK